MIGFFADFVRVLGMPKSVGEIYGLLFVSSSPLALDDLVGMLKISKGSASQGLRSLKELGAVRETFRPAASDRRTYYEPAVELKRLVGGFIREQIRPHLQSGHAKLGAMRDEAQQISCPERREFVAGRIARVDQWLSRGGKMLPVLQKILGE